MQFIFVSSIFVRYLRREHTTIRTELSPQFIYNFHEGPLSTPPDLFLQKVVAASEKDKLELNCQLYTSAVTRARGFIVPDYYRSSEHWEDPEGYLTDIPKVLAKRGDIVGFSKSEETDPKRIHLGIVKDHKDGEIQIVHASWESQTVEETLLDEVRQRENHGTLRFIKRPVVIFQAADPLALRKLRFE